MGGGGGGKGISPGRSTGPVDYQTIGYIEKKRNEWNSTGDNNDNR